jgi:hypothetical protein
LAERPPYADEDTAARVLRRATPRSRGFAAHHERATEKADEIGIELSAARYTLWLERGSEVPPRPGVSSAVECFTYRAGFEETRSEAPLGNRQFR